MLLEFWFHEWEEIIGSDESFCTLGEVLLVVGQGVVTSLLSMDVKNVLILFR